MFRQHIFRTQHSFFSGIMPQDLERDIAYTEWGDPENPKVLLCVHGLTRNGRDFDRLAEAMAADYRVICPDVVGRGKSQWLSNPVGYNYHTDVMDLLHFVDSLDVPEVDWVGTSMGGLIAMMLLDRRPGLISSLVLNDIGAYIPAESLQRISKYVGVMPEFIDLASAERHMRKAYAPFGIEHDSDWEYFTKHSVRQLPNGKYTLAYDPAIAHSTFKLMPGMPIPAFVAWDLWMRIQPERILVIHGEESDILHPDVTAQMKSLRTDTEVVTFAGIGHAPALVDPAHITTIKDWLNRR